MKKLKSGYPPVRQSLYAAGVGGRGTPGEPQGNTCMVFSTMHMASV